MPSIKGYEYFLIPTAIAFVIRLVYHFWGIPDLWGDAYHNVYISNAIIENNWVYSDFKGREVVWLPFYRYLAAFFMFLFGSSNLSAPHFLNMIIGSVSCGVLSSLTASYSNKHYGQLAGLLMAFLPWHVAYSHINMPEITASLILLLIVSAQYTSKWYWLIPLSFLGVLTKNELTLYIGFFGLYTIWVRDWKSVIALIAGGTPGLVVWGHWNWVMTGEPLWWIAERSLGSGWDKTFYSFLGDTSGSWYMPLMSILQVFPFIFILLLKLQLIRGVIKTKGDAFLKGITVVVLSSWLFIIIMNLGYFPTPDARYFIITLPLACLVFVLWMYKIQAGNRIIKLVVAGLMVLWVVELPIFYFLQFKMAPSIEMGKYIKNSDLDEGSFWLDFPVTVYFSEVQYDRVFSSEMMVPKEKREGENFIRNLRNDLKSKKIKYVAFQDVPYSYTGSIWSEMNENKPFDWNEFRFEPIFHYTFEAESQSINNKIKAIILEREASSLWKVSYTP